MKLKDILNMLIDMDTNLDLTEYHITICINYPMDQAASELSDDDINFINLFEISIRNVESNEYSHVKWRKRVYRDRTLRL